MPDSRPTAVSLRFAPAEWRLLREAPIYAGLVVATAQRGGFFWEALSIARAFADARAQHGQSSLLDAICADRPHVEPIRFRTADALREHAFAHIRAAVELLTRKADPADLDVYARFLVAVAERVAYAYPETGVRVTAAERRAVAEVAAAAGLRHRSGVSRSRSAEPSPTPNGSGGGGHR